MSARERVPQVGIKKGPFGLLFNLKENYTTLRERVKQCKQNGGFRNSARPCTPRRLQG